MLLKLKESIEKSLTEFQKVGRENLPMLEKGKNDGLVDALHKASAFLVSSSANDRQNLILYFDNQILEQLKLSEKKIAEFGYENKGEFDYETGYSDNFVDTMKTIKTTALNIVDNTI